MPSQKEIEGFISSQKSLQFYKKAQDALKEVLSSLNEQEYEKATKNLVIAALHEGSLGQAMHFPGVNGKFTILQLILPGEIPVNVLRYVIAHELGHALQGRNWKKGDGMKLERDADEKARQWGFPKTAEVKKWISNYRKKAE